MCMTTTPKASAIIMHWHLQVGAEHLMQAAEVAAVIHPGTAYAGVIKAAMSLVIIATDPHAAQDYGPMCVADEALRGILGSLLMGIPAPESKAGPAGTPREPGQILSPGAMTKATTPPPHVIEQSLSAPFTAAAEVTQAALGL